MAKGLPAVAKYKKAIAAFNIGSNYMFMNLHLNMY